MYDGTKDAKADVHPRQHDRIARRRPRIPGVRVAQALRPLREAGQMDGGYCAMRYGRAHDGTADAKAEDLPRQHDGIADAEADVPPRRTTG